MNARIQPRAETDPAGGFSLERVRKPTRGVGFAAWCLVSLSVSLWAQQNAPRDPGTTPAAGTGVLSGTVVIDDAISRPLRRAIVTLNGIDVMVARTTITDDAGRFAFAALPAGRFNLSATKAAYVTTYYGNRRPGRSPAVPIPLAAGQQLTDVTLRMLHGAVITGIVRDQTGGPAPFSSIRVQLVQSTNGERTASPLFSGSSFSDERGVYRVFGLVPGDYVISASVPRIFNSSDVRVTAEGEIDRAQIAVREASAMTAPAAAAPPPPARDVPTVGYATVYYPGTTEFASAGLVTLAPAEERTGVDIPLVMVPISAIDGIVIGADGLPVESATVNLVSSGPLGTSSSGTQTSATGTFAMSGLSPGSYTLLARPVWRDPFDGTTEILPLWASMDLTLDGHNMHDIVLTLQKSVTLSGRIVVDAARETPLDLTRVTVSLESAFVGGGQVFSVTPVAADASGAFTLTGVTPGKYRLRATIAAALAPKWTIKSAVFNNRETVEVAADIRPNEPVRNAVITVSDRVTELSGQLVNGAGAPAPEYGIVLFAADKQYWTKNSRRVRGPIRPGADGRYVVNDLTPGVYYLAAVTDIDPSELNDAALLEQLVSAGIRITIAEGEKKIQDLRIGG